ncbi:hypothetical protein R1sor_003521 [Riccia sorocarpa]|uniref:G-patch domain-containing protein n=1 Tax=Riccia sorocarpa TaxID=122646 RepID=A0ABD3H4P3_9MARC
MCNQSNTLTSHSAKPKKQGKAGKGLLDSPPLSIITIDWCLAGTRIIIRTDTSSVSEHKLKASKMEIKPAKTEESNGRRSESDPESAVPLSSDAQGADSHVGVQEAETGAPVKFAFAASKPKFSASRPPRFPKGKQQRSSDDESREMEYVTGFDEQGIVPKDPKGRLGARVIPKLENSWRPEKRMKHIMMESDILENAGTRFEAEVETALREANAGTQYGLTMGVKKINTTETTTTITNTDGKSIVETVVTEKQVEHTTKLSFSAIEEQRLKQDMATLPDEADLDAYEDMPVESFGEAMLRGMGWEKGKPIGRNCKDVIVPVEYVRRTDRTGLGAEAAPKEVRTKKYIKPGESRTAAPELVAAAGPDGRGRNVISLDEKLVERKRKGVAKGKVMSIVSGRHLGLRGEVLEVLDSDRVSVKLLKSEEKVVVSSAELADIGSLEEEKVLKQIRRLNLGNGEASEGSSGRDERKYDRNEDRRDRDTRYDDGYKAHSRRDDEERVKSKKEGRRDERGQYDSQRRSSRGGEMEVDDDRARRGEDRSKSSSRDYRREHRRDEAREDSRKDGKKDDERNHSRSYRDDADGKERVGRSRSSRDRAEERTSSADRSSSGAALSGGRITDSWLRSRIRVRVISKTLNGGKLYLKKGVIVDVISPKECDILMDESREIIQAVKQEQVETALPKKGGRVMVVGGRDYRGKLGKLIERGTEKGVVQLEESFQIETMDLDHLAEYTADSHELDD